MFSSISIGDCFNIIFSDNWDWVKMICKESTKTIINVTIPGYEMNGVLGHLCAHIG